MLISLNLVEVIKSVIPLMNVAAYNLKHENRTIFGDLFNIGYTHRTRLIK